MYRSLLDALIICLMALMLRSEDAKTSTRQNMLETTELPISEVHSDVTTENQQGDEIDELAHLEEKDDNSEFDDPLIAEYLAHNRFPKIGSKARRMKRNLPFANDDLGNFLRFLPDENIDEYLMDHPSMEVSDDSSESYEKTSEEGKEFLKLHSDLDPDLDIGNLEADLINEKLPTMRRLNQYYDEYDEEIDEEKLFAHQFPSLEEMMSKSRLDMNDLYQKLAQHRPPRPRP